MLIGNQTPRLSSVPEYETSPWPQLRGKLAQIGFTVDEWQSDFLRDLLGRTEDGRFAAPNALLIVPRQNGKNHIIAARQLIGLLFAGERAIHTGHELSTAMEHLQFLRRVINDAGLDKIFKIKSGNMEMSIENLRNGAKLVFKARSRGAARGFAGYDALYLDEAFAIQDEEMAAILPTVAAKSMAGKMQMIYTSSAGMPGSDVLKRFREQCITGVSGWLFAEWSVEAGADITDVENWRLANPALGVRISADYIRTNELQAMGAEQFGRERLGIWNEDKAETVIAPALWREGNITDDEIPDAEKISLAVEVSADGQYSTLALATGFGGADGVFVQLIAHQPGTYWVADMVKQLQSARKVVEVVSDSAGAVLGLHPELARAGIKVRMLGLPDVKAACAGFLNDIHSHRLFHTDDEATRLVATAAGKRPIGPDGSWAWKRLGPLDVSPLVALTFAHFSWQQHAAKRVRGPARVLDIPL